MPYISSVIILLTYIYVLLTHARVRESKLFFCLFSLFTFRLLLSFNHEITFAPLFAGQSINALFSIFSVVVLSRFVIFRQFNEKRYFPLLMLIAAIALSTLHSGMIFPGVAAIMKWLLMLFIVMSLVLLFKLFPVDVIFKPFICIFYAILLSQALSVILGAGKDTESLASASNSVSYIAGYAHEGAFSILLYAGLLLSSILMIEGKVKRIIPLLFFVGIIAANYRTVIISAVILFLFTYWSHFFIGSDRKFKVVVIMAGSALLTCLIVVFGGVFADRFSELGSALVSLSELMSVDYELFSLEERRLLSSRLYIWNMYMSGYTDFPFLGLLFGAGPSSWLLSFQVYAHNSFVGILYDAGFVGLISLLLLFSFSFIMLKKIAIKKVKVILLGALLGFFVMANSTMPFWGVEGLYTFAFIYSLIITSAGLNPAKMRIIQGDE